MPGLRPSPALICVLVACLLPTVATVSATPAPWQSAPAVCEQLLAEGWRAEDPLGAGQTGRSEVEFGGALSIYVCRVTREWPARGRGRAPSVDVFVQRGGGGGLVVTASFWNEADREALLAVSADLLARLTRDLHLPAPAPWLAAMRAGASTTEEEAGLAFSVDTTTRAEELVSQPDLKPADVPLLAIKASVGPPREN